MTAEAEIRRRIEQQGRIAFAEFMNVALYWPEGGYYTSSEPFGASGDYYTSPMVHPVFGALLAVQLFQMWLLLGNPRVFTVVETGSGNGVLCRDILDFGAGLPGSFKESLRYVCIDRRVPTEDALAGEDVARVAATGVPLRGITGCFLSNELLDAFPVHRVRMEQGQLLEAYLALEGEAFVHVWDEPSTPELAARLHDRGIELAEGQTAEISLGLEQWAGEVASALETGFVLTIDYGQPAAQLYSSKLRPRGTLTTYHRHAQTDDPLHYIGQQDISAQVDFTSAAEAGKQTGLQTLGFTSQARFLSNLGHAAFRDNLRSLKLPSGVMQANRAGLMDLVKPEGLGNFKVLAQGKNVGQPKLWGFQPDAGIQGLIENLDFPLLTPRHISLPRGLGITPPAEFTLKSLWPGDGDPQ